MNRVDVPRHDLELTHTYTRILCMTESKVILYYTNDKHTCIHTINKLPRRTAQQVLAHRPGITTGFSQARSCHTTVLSGCNQPHKAYNPVAIHQMVPPNTPTTDIQGCRQELTEGVFLLFFPLPPIPSSPTSSLPLPIPLLSLASLPLPFLPLHSLSLPYLFSSLPSPFLSLTFPSP